MELANINTMEKLLSSHGFSFKKSLGQNFLIDPSVCPAMAAAACRDNCGALEIGPGIGVLTEQLAKKAKRVVAIELDTRLQPVLDKTLASYDNTKVIFGDAMKLDLKTIIEQKFPDCDSVCVCANLPYYITSPLIMNLLEQRLPIDNITVMVQKEAAERLCSMVGSRESGAVTVAVNYYAEAEILFNVNRNSFLPPPKVDSAVINLKIRNTPPVSVRDEKIFFKFVKACFSQRRKTLVNTVSNTLGIEKERIKDAMNAVGLDNMVRSEQLTMEQLASLCDRLF